MVIYFVKYFITFYPIGSMYGIDANIWGILMVNVTIYSSTMDPMGIDRSILRTAQETTDEVPRIGPWVKTFGALKWDGRAMIECMTITSVVPHFLGLNNCTNMCIYTFCHILIHSDVCCICYWSTMIYNDCACCDLLWLWLSWYPRFSLQSHEFHEGSVCKKLLDANNSTSTQRTKPTNKRKCQAHPAAEMIPSTWAYYIIRLSK